MAVFAALAACFGCLLAILGEVARIVPGTAAAMAALAALAAGFRSAFAIIGEVARTVLSADMTGARGFFPIFREVAWVASVSFFSHLFPLYYLQMGRQVI